MQITISTKQRTSQGRAYEERTYQLLDDNGKLVAKRTSSTKAYTACAIHRYTYKGQEQLVVTWHDTPELAHKEGQARMGKYGSSKGYTVVQASAELVAEGRGRYVAKRTSRASTEEACEAMRSACWGATAKIREGKIAEAQATLDELRAKAEQLRGPKQRQVAAYYAGIVSKELTKAQAPKAQA